MKWITLAITAPGVLLVLGAIVHSVIEHVRYRRNADAAWEAERRSP